MITKTNRKLERERRHRRVRTKISGTPECPRLCVFRSNTNLYAQVIDDVAGNTLVSASTLDKEVKTKKSNIAAAKEVGALIAKRAEAKKIKTKKSNKEAAKEVGALVAKRALQKNIKSVVYDRGGYIYHGVVKELAESAREGGLEF